MTDWRDPLVIAKTDGSFLLDKIVLTREPDTAPIPPEAFLKLLHVLAGLVVWEVLKTCDYEFNVFRGKCAYRWTIWVHLGYRLSTVMVLAILVVQKDFTGLTDCRAWDTAVYVFGFGTRVVLMLLRIVAIWNWNMFIVAISSLVWLMSIGLNIWYLVIVRSTYQPAVKRMPPGQNQECLAQHRGHRSVRHVSSHCNARWHRQTPAQLGNKRTMARALPAGASLRTLSCAFWLTEKKGLAWLALAVVAEVPAVCRAHTVEFKRTPGTWCALSPFDVTFSSRDGLQMFEIVTLVAISIGATRMYRVLSNYRPLTALSPYQITDDRVRIEQLSVTYRDDGTLVRDLSFGGAVPMVCVDVSIKGEQGGTGETLSAAM
ncbi:hypothetical protein FA95DRAFT_1606289 [Auriscalpium vulgare]|uniref:Uncharacterized protein n=1 Tax=Auriscalpium vulgare TaxID=40419 RepID=A0ACB8RTV0_9AGAM|nr:hypothetical protein FA95DRAFT_1606289 [Auriscalpium vulgare]